MKKALSLKTVLLLILSALLIASAGFLMSLNLTTAEAETSASEERIATDVVLEDSWSVDSSRVISCGKNYDYTFSTTGKPVSRKYEVKLNDFLANEWGGSGYNHMYVLYGRIDAINAIYSCWESSGFTILKNITVLYPELFSEPLSGTTPQQVEDPVEAIKRKDKTGTISGFEVGKVNPFVFTISWDEGNVYDLGIIVFYKFSTIFSYQLRNVALFSSTPKTDVVNYLLSNSDYAQKDESGLSVAFTKDYPMARALGVAPDLEAEGQVNVKYQKLVDGHFNTYEEAEKSFVLNSDNKVLFSSKNNLLNMLNAADPEYAVNGLAAFNTYYTSNAGYFMENEQVGKIETFGSRITRSAQGITSSYSLLDSDGNPVQIPDNIVLTVDYNTYTYDRFFIRINNSNETVANNLTVDIYPTSYTDSNGKHYLYFDYQTIRNMFTNSLLWTVEGDITITLPEFESDYVNFYEEENNGSRRLVVVVDQNHDDALMGLEIIGTAFITPPVDLDITVQYKALDGNLSVSDSSFNLGVRSSANFGQIAAELLSEQGSWANYIYGSISPAVLNGLIYYSPVNVLYGDSLNDYVNNTATFVIQYEYNTAVVVVSNNINDNLQVLPLSNAVPTYSLKSLGVSLPDGYRVFSFTHDRFSIYTDIPSNPYVSEFIRSDVDKSRPYRIELELVDTWPIIISYLQRYKETPFAELKKTNMFLRIADYLNSDKEIVLTKEDICTLLELDTDVIEFQKQSVDIAQINKEYNERTGIFTFDCIYSVINVKYIQADGFWDFINVALTPYSDWLNFFGKDWSIMALNNPQTGKFFERSTDIAPENLYGFFSLVSFKTQYKDFTELFKDFTSAGCVSMFSQKEVKGSDFYKFSTGTSNAATILGAICGGVIGLCIGHPLLGAGIGAAIGGGANFVANSVSEAVNTDNGTYYSYFYYVDGTSEYNYVALNGADNYNDTSHASGNWFQHAGETIAGWWNAFWNSANIFVVIIKIILISAVVIIVGGLLYKLIKKFWLDKK